MCGVGLPEIVLNPLPFPFLCGLVLICGFTAVVVSAVSRKRKRAGREIGIESEECNQKVDVCVMGVSGRGNQVEDRFRGKGDGVTGGSALLFWAEWTTLLPMCLGEF